MPSLLLPYVIRTRQGLFHFRITIPASLRPMVGKREIRRSLRTRSKREAILRASHLVVNAHRLIEAAYAGTRPDLDTLRLDAPFVIADAGALFSKRETESPSLSDLMETYRSSQQREGVSEKTIDDKVSVTKLLVRIIVNIPVSDIFIRHAKQFRDAALKLSPMVTRLLHNKTLEKEIEEADKTISTPSTTTIMSRHVELRTHCFSVRKTADIIGRGLSTVQRAEKRASVG